MMPAPLFLSDAQIDELGISPAEVADAIEVALGQKASGELHVTPKSAVLPGGGRYVMSTLSVGDGPGLTVLKAVTVSPGNPSRGLPGIVGAIMVLDAETGELRAVMDAGWITAYRTAALSAVAARRLADPAARIISFVGCGAQARSHLDAFAATFPLAEIRALGRGHANVRRLCDKADSMGLKAREVGSGEAALDGADIVVSSVPLDYSIEPFLDARLLAPGAFAAITDLGIPWKSESWGSFGNIYVDDLEQERSAERPMLPFELVSGDLQTLVGDGTFRRQTGKPNAFAFRGIALGDFAATALVLDRAIAKGVA